MVNITEEEINAVLVYKELIEALRKAFSSDNINVPDRMHLDLPGNNISLIMPAWNQQYYGLKQIIACPDNPKAGLPTIQGTYDLFDVTNGHHLAEIEPRKLTAIRTAATSVLAASYLKKEASKLLIMGAGVLAAEMIQTYSSLYEIDQILIWNRTKENAEKLVRKFRDSFPVRVVHNLEADIAEADIVTCVTHSHEPILNGNWIKAEAHVDLVGSYKNNMREADDAMISKSDIYIDDERAKEETGDLSIPLSNNIISEKDILGNLFQLCKGEVIPQQNKKPTLFKSVGHAIEDLAAAIYLYEKTLNQ